MNYFDILLAKKLRGGGGGDITIKSLNVTQNGTYSEEGVAYSPVKVNVPLPENAYLLKEIEDVEIATFTDGSDLPMPKLEVAIEPQQEGSGEPSPTNIRPISGWDEVNVGVNNGNWWDEEYQIYGSGATARIGNKNPIPCKPNTTYYITKAPSYGWKFYDKDMNVLSTFYNKTYTTPSNCYYMSFQLDESYGTTYNNDVCINTISTNYYTPYNGQTYTLDLDGTRYGGKVDLVNGVLTITHGYIASYNGETLPSTWISDRDVYAEDTTPTIGAEVCYELATPTTIQLPPTVVKSLRGVNNVYADSGDVLDLSYFGKEE